jgi:hypothetical protein
MVERALQRGSFVGHRRACHGRQAAGDDARRLAGGVRIDGLHHLRELQHARIMCGGGRS